MRRRRDLARSALDRCSSRSTSSWCSATAHEGPSFALERAYTILSSPDLPAASGPLGTAVHAHRPFI
jgi:hypothetical protein